MLHDQLKSRLSDRATLPVSAAAAERFMAGGFPKPTEEAWRFTNLNALSNRDFSPMPDALLDQASVLPDGKRLVFYNGVLQPHLSTDLPAGASFASLADDAELLARLDDDRLSGHAIANLSVAMMTSGLGLRVKGAVSEPIHLVFRNDGADQSSHAVIVLDIADEAEATLIEHHHGQGDGLSAPIMAVRVGASAIFHHARVQNEDDRRNHLAVMAMDVEESGRYNALSVQTGSALSRVENRIALVGEHVDMAMTTLYLARQDQVMDVTTLVDHQKPNCTSRQIVRGVLDDQAKGIFQGKVIVARDAQKTDGNQMSRTLLLSRKCEADAKPELEIYADDVACSHGATVGEIDDNHLFYLMSRGISKQDARQMLIEAFLADVLDDIDHDAMKAPALECVSAWLTTLGERS
jgi:Fe-S cluster assembly protein SufD